MADEEGKGKWVWTKLGVLVPVPEKWCGISKTTTSVSTSASDFNISWRRHGRRGFCRSHRGGDNLVLGEGGDGSPCKKGATVVENNSVYGAPQTFYDYDKDAFITRIL